MKIAPAQLETARGTTPRRSPEMQTKPTHQRAGAEQRSRTTTNAKPKLAERCDACSSPSRTATTMTPRWRRRRGARPRAWPAGCNVRPARSPTTWSTQDGRSHAVRRTQPDRRVGARRLDRRQQRSRGGDRVRDPSTRRLRKPAGSPWVERCEDLGRPSQRSPIGAGLLGEASRRSGHAYRPVALITPDRAVRARPG
jgi:hypothetical protein